MQIWDAPYLWRAPGPLLPPSTLDLPELSDLPSCPLRHRGTVGTSLGFRISHIRYQTLVGLVYFVLKFTKDRCKGKDAFPASWVPSPCSREESDE